MRMIHTQYGDAVFFKCLQYYLQKFKYRNAEEKDVWDAFKYDFCLFSLLFYFPQTFVLSFLTWRSMVLLTSFACKERVIHDR